MEDGDKATQASTQDGTGAVAPADVLVVFPTKWPCWQGPSDAIESPSFGQSLWEIQSSARPWEHGLLGVGRLEIKDL